MTRVGDRIPCNPATPCKYRETDSCFEDLHHEAWPRRDYTTPLEKRFRNHVLNKVIICRAIHDDEHAQGLIPVKPTREEMRRFIDE